MIMTRFTQQRFAKILRVESVTLDSSKTSYISQSYLHTIQHTVNGRLINHFNP